MEVCPVTQEECVFFTAAQNLRLPGISAPGANNRLATQLFNENHQSLIDQAQEAYCSEKHCGVEVFAVAQCVNLTAIAEVQVECNT